MTGYEKNLFETRYRANENEKTWSDIFKRVSNEIGKIDKEKLEYYNLMNDGYFLPSSPQLWNFGVYGKNGSSCFTMHIGDTLEEIYQADWEACQIYKHSGGTGYNLSPIRPRGTIIHGSPNKSVGVIPIVERLESTTKYITSGGRSRGALMCQLDVVHPDILEFIFCKKPLKIIVDNLEQWDIPLQNVNISVRCSDEFMNAVENDDNWILQWSNDNQELKIKTWEELNKNLHLDPNDWKDVNRQRFVKYILNPIFDRFKGKIKAQQLWILINENAHSFADPGIVFTNNFETYNPHPQCGELHFNPCAEFLGIDYSSCNLGSMNLRKFWIDNNFDYSLYQEKVKIATKYLIDVLNYTELPIKTINEVSKFKTRPIGLGIMKLADILLLAKIKYGSKEAIEFSKYIMALTTVTAWETSFKLVQDNNQCYIKPEYWNDKALKNIFKLYSIKCKKYKIEDLQKRYNNLINLIEQNNYATTTVVTSVAPTGSIAQICSFINKYDGESSGIEPVFSWETYRKDASGSKTVKHDLAPKDKKEFYHVVSNEIPVEEHVRMQAAIADFTSMSVSKTLNLPNNATVKDVENAYLLAWKLGIKGTTVYRDGSKVIQVLKSLDDKVEIIEEAFKEPVISDIRSDRIYGFTEKVQTANGSIYVTINKYLNEEDYNTVREILQNRGKIAEIFGSHGKSGTDIAGYMQTICRQASYILRKAKAPIEDVLKQLRGVSFSPSWHRGRLITSPVDAVAYVIERELDLKNKKIKKVTKEIVNEQPIKEIIKERCSICGQEYIHIDGCVSCSCNSKCG